MKNTTAWHQSQIKNFPPADPGHPFLQAKGITIPGLLQDGKNLIVPAAGPDGQVHGAQVIEPDGKTHITGKIDGCFFVIGEEAMASLGNQTRKPVLFVCVNLADAGALYHATGQPAFVSFTHENLEAVSRIASKRNPGARIVFDRDLPLNKGIDAVKKMLENPGPKIEIISLAEIIKRDPQIEFIVDGFLIRKAGHIIHAAGGVGKSTIAGQIAGTIARDKPQSYGLQDEERCQLFETFRIVQFGIHSLFLQSENSMATINTKLRWLQGDPAADRIFFPKIFDDVITTGESFLDDVFIQRVADTIHLIEDKAGHRLDIVWVDPLISFHKGDENAADHMRAALDGVTKLMQMTNTTAVVLHHDNRLGDIRGSGAIDQWARSRMQMKQVWIGEDRIRDMGPDGPVKTVAKVPAVELHHKKANDMALFDKITLAQDGNLMFRLVPDPVDQETATRANEVVKALQDLGGVCSSSRELYRAVSELTGRSESTARKDVSDAVNLGQIERIPNKKGNLKVYGYQVKG